MITAVRRASLRARGAPQGPLASAAQRVPRRPHPLEPLGAHGGGSHHPPADGDRGGRARTAHRDLAAPGRHGSARLHRQLGPRHGGSRGSGPRARAGPCLARLGVRVPGTRRVRVEPGAALGDPDLHHRLHLRRDLRVRKPAAGRAGRSLAHGRDVADPIGDHDPRGGHGHDGARSLSLRLPHRSGFLHPAVGGRVGDGAEPRAWTVEHVLQGGAPYLAPRGRRRAHPRPHGSAQRVRGREVLRCPGRSPPGSSGHGFR